MPSYPSPDPRNLLVGRGALFFDFFDPTTGTPSGNLVNVGNCTLYEVSDKVETKEKYTSQDPSGALLAKVVTRQTVGIKITADEFNAQNIATALNGTINGDGTISIATVPQVDVHVQFIPNNVRGPAWQADYWHVMFTPSGSIGFIKDDFADMGLEGTIISDPVGHPLSPQGLLTPL